MTEPWKNGYLQSSALNDPLDNPVVQLESARQLLDEMDARFRAVEECNERALRLHRMEMTSLGPFCTCCQTSFPCETRRALTGADEAAA